MAEQLRAFGSNYVLMAALAGWFTAQFFKMIITLIKDRKFNFFRMLFSTGGMPSSHTATVCALFTASAIKYGLGSFQFAVTSILAMIVITDALGVRRETGNQAKVLNRIIEEMFSGDHKRSEKALKELVGHSPIQVFMGAVVGISMTFVVASIMHVS